MYTVTVVSQRRFHITRLLKLQHIVFWLILFIFFDYIYSVSAFPYECFGFFCETSKNQFCNYRREIRHCDYCTPSVCAWDKVPKFCAEYFCPGLSTTTEISKPQEKPGANYSTAFLIVLVCLACVILCIVVFIVRKLCNRKAGKENGWEELRIIPITVQTDHGMSDASTSTEPMDVIVGTIDGARGGQRRLQELLVNNDTNGGRMGRSEGVMNDVDHRKFYELGDNYAEPETKTKHPTQETLDEVARCVGNDTELKECPLRVSDTWIPSTCASGFDSLSADAFGCGL